MGCDTRGEANCPRKIEVVSQPDAAPWDSGRDASKPVIMMCGINHPMPTPAPTPTLHLTLRSVVRAVVVSGAMVVLFVVATRATETLWWFAQAAVIAALRAVCGA